MGNPHYTLISASVTTDQRGLPRINHGTVDVGAYEFQSVAPTICLPLWLNHSDWWKIRP